MILLDEIQKSPNAIKILKFVADSDKYDVISNGYLLGVYLNEVSSFPVGYVEIYNMYQLDF